ncbi:hypothetical protein TNCV_872441 [Trichonephila clavipes]|nr:hypothetical protein TNCV_872441 [Trichonephila clavipes]
MKNDDLMWQRHPGGYPQCQRDKSIDRPSVWCTRYGNGVDFRPTGLLSPSLNGVGTEVRSAGCRSTTLINQRLLGA